MSLGFSSGFSPPAFEQNYMQRNFRDRTNGDNVLTVFLLLPNILKLQIHLVLMSGRIA